MLIIGGLFALAVIAILGAVLLGINEERAIKAKQAKQQPTHDPANAPQDETVLRQVTVPWPSVNAVQPTPVLEQPSGHLDVFNGDDDFLNVHGQAREFTGELRALAQKAGELERRLNNLTELFEHQHLRPSDETSTPVPVSEAPVR